LAALAVQMPECAPAAAADRSLWNRRLAHYRRLAARAKEAAERGWFREANDRYYRACAEIAARFGGKEAAAQSPEARHLRCAAFQRVDQAEDAYWHRCTDPMQKAAVALVLTPAPALPALRVKLAVMRAHELDEPDALPRHALDVLDEDIGRLTRRHA
jgi:hypothetical protein